MSTIDARFSVNRRKAYLSAPMHLEQLTVLCDRFAEVCKSATTCDDPKRLLYLADLLWDMTNSICSGIELFGGLDSSQFRAERFEPKVLCWYRTHPVIERLWSKPAGYSGDYQVIELICQDQRSCEKFEDVFANHLLRSEMACQHRGKVAEQALFIAEVFRGGAERFVRLLNVGSGPCYDVRMALEGHGALSPGEIVLVDLDPRALEFAQPKLNSLADANKRDIKFTCINDDALHALRSVRTSSRERGYDALLFGGLFDYLSDRQVVMLLKVARRVVKSGGHILFSQVSTDNPNRVLMEWYADWKLIERDEHSILSLCMEAGFAPGDVELFREKTGVAIMGRLKILANAIDVGRQ